jgi:hypothetical protein
MMIETDRIVALHNNPPPEALIMESAILSGFGKIMVMFAAITEKSIPRHRYNMSIRIILTQISKNSFTFLFWKVKTYAMINAAALEPPRLKEWKRANVIGDRLVNTKIKKRSKKERRVVLQLKWKRVF